MIAPAAVIARAPDGASTLSQIRAAALRGDDTRAAAIVARLAARSRTGAPSRRGAMRAREFAVDGGRVTFVIPRPPRSSWLTGRLAAQRWAIDRTGAFALLHGEAETPITVAWLISTTRTPVGRCVVPCVRAALAYAEAIGADPYEEHAAIGIVALSTAFRAPVGDLDVDVADVDSALLDVGLVDAAARRSRARSIVSRARAIWAEVRRAHREVA